MKNVLFILLLTVFNIVIGYIVGHNEGIKETKEQFQQDIPTTVKSVNKYLQDHDFDWHVNSILYSHWSNTYPIGLKETLSTAQLQQVEELHEKEYAQRERIGEVVELVLNRYQDELLSSFATEEAIPVDAKGEDPRYFNLDSLLYQEIDWTPYYDK